MTSTEPSPASPELDALAAEIMARLDELAAISETPGLLTRRYLTPEHRAANDLVAAWMREAGMSVREDAVGNVIGRYEGATAGAPALLIGSHLDSVVDAGRYDGMLGVVTGIACVKTLAARGQRLPHAVEVVGFCDEEGTRFQSTYLGSRAVAGAFESALLERSDAEGVTLAKAMTAFGLDPARVGESARRPEELVGYLELHIEQGPVLEDEGLPVGVVTAISGQTRLVLMLEGIAGHAGTVPMGLRKDALAGAAACVLAVEELCRAHPPVVGTVGRLTVAPDATNVIPGSVQFTLDLRAPDDAQRESVLAALRERFETVARERGLTLSIETVHQAGSVACAEPLRAHLAGAIERCGWPVRELPSGAGHDAAAMAGITDVGMIFVRCDGGISHNPAEAITTADAAAGARVLLDAITSFPERREGEE